MITLKSPRVLLPLAGLVALVGFAPLAVPAAAQQSAPQPVVFARRMRAEKHPELRKALRRLEAAQDALQHAAHDFDGHREKALDLTQQAIAQVKMALASDKT